MTMVQRSLLGSLKKQKASILLTYQVKYLITFVIINEFLFKDNCIGESGADQIGEALKKNKSLKTLNLSGNLIQGIDQKLHFLCVGNKIKGDNLVMIKALKKNVTLTELDLSEIIALVLNKVSFTYSDNKIGDNGILPIKKALKLNSSLKILNLSGT